MTMGTVCIALKIFCCICGKKVGFFTKFDMLLIITCINIWGRYSEALQDKHRLTFLTITESGAAVQSFYSESLASSHELTYKN